MRDKEKAARKLLETYGHLNGRAMKGELSGEEQAELAGMFADFVVGSSPQGIYGASAKELPKTMKDAQANYRAVGGKTFKITGVRIEKVDDIHVAAHADWDFGYVNKAGEAGNVRFTNIYYLTFAGGVPKIFAFITPDEGKAMREHGLV